MQDHALTPEHPVSIGHARYLTRIRHALRDFTRLSNHSHGLLQFALLAERVREQAECAATMQVGIAPTLDTTWLQYSAHHSSRFLIVRQVRVGQRDVAGDV